MRMNQSAVEEGRRGEGEGKRARSCERSSSGLASRRDSKREAHGARGRDHVADHRHVGLRVPLSRSRRLV